MKLINKKTGGVFDAIVREKSNDNGEYSIIVCNIMGIRNRESSFLGEYDSLAELNEEWEDYEPVGPLIKDEKIRKFVRAWAEVNGFNVLKYLEGSHMCELSYQLKNSDGDVVMELLGGIDGLENCKEYTITELCGDEEE